MARLAGWQGEWEGLSSIQRDGRPAVVIFRIRQLQEVHSSITSFKSLLISIEYYCVQVVISHELDEVLHIVTLSYSLCEVNMYEVIILLGN